MVFGFRSPPKETLWKSIDDLDTLIKVKRAQRNKLALREAVPIGVIDDQPFEAETNLRNNHYQIHYMTDVYNIADLSKYPIILCDLQGVGAQLHSDLQGAHLIKEIKTHFPEKVVIAYTGVAKNNVMSRAAQQHADLFLKKDADLDQWISALDSSLIQITDPVYMWKQFRKRLLDTGVTPFQLTKIESSFVENFLQGREEVHRGVMDTIAHIGLQADVRAVIQGFISSLIFKFLVS